MLHAKTSIFDSRWVDMVFENRNHEYGAFELRKKSDDRTLLAIILTISFFGLALAIPVIINSFKDVVTERSIIAAPTVFDLPPTFPDIEPSQKSGAKTAKSSVVEIVKDKPAEKDPIEAKPDDGKPGNTGDDGKKTGEGGGTGTGTGTVTVITTPKDVVTEPGGYAEIMPEFPGGQEALMSYIYKQLNYPPLAIDMGKEGRVTVSFVVNTDGTLSDIKTTNKKVLGWGMEEEVIRVIKLLPRWSPGKQNGSPVRVRMAIPVVFKLN